MLFEQNRARWDQLLIRRGLAALDRADALGGDRLVRASGRDRRVPRARVLSDETDWNRIAALYDELARLTPSPVVELNRAVAVAMARGPEAGLALVDALINDAALRNYHLLPTVRGDLLSKLGRADEARQEFERAAALTRNSRERQAAARTGAGLTGEERSPCKAFHQSSPRSPTTRRRTPRITRIARITRICGSAGTKIVGWSHRRLTAGVTLVRGRRIASTPTGFTTGLRSVDLATAPRAKRGGDQPR